MIIDPETGEDYPSSFIGSPKQFDPPPSGMGSASRLAARFGKAWADRMETVLSLIKQRHPTSTRPRVPRFIAAAATCLQSLGVIATHREFFKTDNGEMWIIYPSGDSACLELTTITSTWKTKVYRRIAKGYALWTLEICREGDKSLFQDQRKTGDFVSISYIQQRLWDEQEIYTEQSVVYRELGKIEKKMGFGCERDGMIPALIGERLFHQIAALTDRERDPGYGKPKVFLPTEEEIAKMTEEFRKSWTAERFMSSNRLVLFEKHG